MMELGVCVASDVSDIDYAVLAEELGYADLWFADSQMIWSDCYAAMAMAAARTSRIRIGTGVAVAGSRPAAVTAAAHATINRLAPGRTFCGIGTGNTAMRIMGHKPIPIAEFDDHLATLRLLLDGKEAMVRWRGATATTRHLMPDTGFVAFTPRMPMYVSAFGPRALQLAVRHGDGLITSVPPTVDGVTRMWDRLQDAASQVGRTITPDDYLTASLTTIVVLEPGEAVDSDRVKADAGAMAIAGLHYSYEQFRQYGRRPPAHLQDFWEDYVALVEEEPEERRHLRIHQGHNCWVIPEEEQFVTKELLEASCLIGTAADVAARLQAMSEAGLRQIVILPPLAVKDRILREVSEQVMPLLTASS
jgi:alkanesulfonate monooxygenase SsuD/methylene tetrahydromethanopterin reductase-like flavin-dependent oxidoreductase (luciferase family)